MTRLHLLGGTDLLAPDGTRLQSILAQPKRTALLAYLVCARRRQPHVRGELLELFWPDLDVARGRAALRKALHFLRAGAGADLFVAGPGETLRVDRSRLWCDVFAFDEALAAGNVRQALELYRGELLDGLPAIEAPGFERWLDAERARLRRAAHSAALDASRRAVERGETGEAWAFAEKAGAIDVANRDSLRCLLELGQRTGDVGRALRLFDAGCQRLRDEFELEPAAELLASAGQLRASRDAANTAGGAAPPPTGGSARTATPPAARAVAAAPLDSARSGADPASPASGAAPDSDVTVAPRSGAADAGRVRRLRPGMQAAAVFAMLLGIAAVLRLYGEPRADAPPNLLAVGFVHDLTESDGTDADALRELLATNLGRVRDVHVVSAARMQELVGHQAADGATLAGAARRAGARQLVEGALYRRGDGSLRLDVRRVDIVRGTVYFATAVEGADVFAVVDAATAALLQDLTGVAPPLRVADVTTRSLVALRFYQEALRHQYQGQITHARPLLEAALAEDSTFAMAAYHLAILEHVDPAALARAVELAANATEAERLLISGMHLFHANDPRALVVAESLASRHPADPNGALLIGRTLVHGGEFGAARAYLERVIATASSTPPVNGAPCRACEAYVELIWSHLCTDSVDAAVRTAQAYVEQHPGSQAALDMLINALELADRSDDALAAIDAHLAVSGDLYYASARRSILDMKRGDFAAVDSLLATPVVEARPDAEAGLLWNGIISMRWQGRLRAAERLAVRYAEVARRRAPGDAPLAELPLAIVLFESGRHAEAATLFERFAHHDSGEPPTRAARRTAWNLTHAATAYAAMGDTVRLRVLADSIERVGSRSAYGRDRILHHHVRGLLARRRGDLPAAIAHFEAANFSNPHGYTRTGYELAGALIEAGRAAEAVPLLEAVLRGGITSSQLYLPHSAVHERLAAAWQQLGRPDRAAHHRAWLERARTHAD